MLSKSIFTAVACLYLFTQLHADKIDNLIENQKVKLSRMCEGLGFELACALDETCVPSCANDYLDVEENKCQYMNESIYDFEVVEFFECKLPDRSPVDEFGQCESGSCVRIV